MFNANRGMIEKRRMRSKPARFVPLSFPNAIYEKYNVTWRKGDDIKPDWKIELECWANNLQTGYSPWHHLKQAMSLMWPEGVWHPWKEWRMSEFCDLSKASRIGDTIVRNWSWMGCGAAGKTHCGINLALTWWLADPNNSIVTLTSTTKERARARMWSVLQQMFADFRELHDFPDPHVINSSMILECQDGERKHAIYTMAVESGELTKCIANIQGSHAPRMFLVVDEAMGTPEAVFAAIPNIFKGAREVNLLFLSNAPHTKLNPFMKLACPVTGWNSVQPDAKVWQTKPVPAWQVPGGWCLHFSGLDSPNVKAGKNLWPFLYSLENWQRVQGNEEIAKTPQFWSQDLGFPPPEGALFTVLTESLIEARDAMGMHIFDSYARPFAGMDPSWGNDECKLVFGVVGDLSTGLQGIQITGHLTIPIDVTAKDKAGKRIPPDFQIAERVMMECDARGVIPECLGIMAGGNPGVISRLQQEWGDVFTIQEGGTASDLPASSTDFRPACEVYDRRVTELYFLVRSFIEGAQLKGLYQDAVDQFCNRLYVIEKSHRRNCIEKKDEFKPRFGRSPDDAEAIIALCAAARNQGCEPRGVDTKPAAVYDEVYDQAVHHGQELSETDESGKGNDAFAMFEEENAPANEAF